MDYRFFVRDAGAIDAELLDPLVARIEQMGPGENKVGRFTNNTVYGVMANQFEDVDNMVSKIKKALVGTIPELDGADFINYYSINWMEANGYIKEHTDITNGSSFDDLWTHKIHIPLITNPECKVSFRRNFTERADWHHLSKGRAWLYNNQVFHSVVNKGPARAHLILYARDSQMVKHMKRTKLWTLLDEKNR